jgi:hypothetical protein
MINLRFKRISTNFPSSVPNFFSPAAYKAFASFSASSLLTSLVSGRSPCNNASKIFFKSPLVSPEISFSSDRLNTIQKKQQLKS